jgi:hypothetical protein
MKVLLPRSIEPWALVIFGGGFGFSRSFFLVIHTSHNKKEKSKKGKKTPMQPLNVSARGRCWYKHITYCLRRFFDVGASQAS